MYGEHERPKRMLVRGNILFFFRCRNTVGKCFNQITPVSTCKMWDLIRYFNNFQERPRRKITYSRLPADLPYSLFHQTQFSGQPLSLKENITYSFPIFLLYTSFGSHRTFHPVFAFLLRCSVQDPLSWTPHAQPRVIPSETVGSLSVCFADSLIPQNQNQGHSWKRIPWVVFTCPVHASSGSLKQSLHYIHSFLNEQQQAFPLNTPV